MVAAQNQALAVRAVQSRIYGLSVPVSHRVCGKVPEYVDHLLSSCTPLAATMYKQRQNRIASIAHWSILKRFNQSVSCNYCIGIRHEAIMLQKLSIMLLSSAQKNHPLCF